MKLKLILFVICVGVFGVMIKTSCYMPEKKYRSMGQLAQPHFSQIAQKRESNIGRDYYNSIVSVALERNWVLPVTGSCSYTDNAFNNNHKKCSLGNQIFGQSFTLQDIYLISRLSRNAKVSVALSNFPGVFQRANPISGTNPFGVYGSDQYIGLLAPLEISFGDVGSSEHGFLLSLLHRWQLTCSEKLRLVAGAVLPFKSVEHRFNYTLLNANFSTRPFTTGTTVRSTPLEYFYKDFSSVEDFFIRGVLGAKGINLKPTQRKTGVGDLNVFASIDVADYLPWYIAGCEFGLIGIVPTAGKDDGKSLWTPILGNGGAYQMDLFAQAHFQTAISAWNPVIRFAGNFSKSFINCHQRVAAVKSSGGGIAGGAPVTVSSISGLRSPETFAGYFVQPFNELDSNIAMFSDTTAPVCIKYGHRFTIGLGNHVYNAFNLGFRLGMFYTYMHKLKDRAQSAIGDASLNTRQLEMNTDQEAHTVSWNLVYEFENMVELSIGSQHVVAGKNVPQNHEWFATLALVF